LIAPRIILGGDVNQTKFILVFFNLIFSSFVIGYETKISIFLGKEGKDKVNCSYAGSDYYECKKGKREIFVKYLDLFEHSPLSGFEIGQNGELKFIEFEKFVVDGELKTNKSVRQTNRPHLSYTHGEKLLEDRDVQSRLTNLQFLISEISDDSGNVSERMKDIFKSADLESKSTITKLKKSPVKFDVRGKSYKCKSPKSDKGECLVSACENENQEKAFFIRLFHDGSTGEFFRFSVDSKGELNGAGYVSSIDFENLDKPYFEPLSGAYYAADFSAYEDPEENNTIITSKMKLPNAYIKEKEKFEEITDDKNIFTFEAAIEFCPKPLRDQYLKAKDKAMGVLAAEKMVQLIERTNEELRSDLVNESFLPKGLCHKGGFYFEEEAREEVEKLVPQGPKKTISMDEAVSLFNEQKDRSDIAWNHLEDGCYARAHLMTRAFDKLKISTDKIWVRGDLEKRLPNGEVVKWDFHVAPIVYVKHKGKTVKMVIDPSISNKPVTVDQWLKEFDRNTINGRKAVQTTYPMPENARAYGRTVIAFSDKFPMSPTPDMEASEEDLDQEARDVMDQFLNFK